MNHLGNRTAVAVTISLLALSLSASTDFRILADADNNASTGCTA